MLHFGARKRILHRFTAAVLAAVLLCGLMPAFTPAARADEPDEPVSWAQEYLEQLVDWGVMRGDIDGNLLPDRQITRAEFVTLVNRAYGYDQVGVNPFADVSSSSWYADDISIAYNVGYFTGTSPTTASPNNNLTREQAALLLGRNMMLQTGAGEVLGFSDSRQFSEWSRDMIQAIAQTGVVTGYPDGSFGPQNYITRGEVACMLVKAIGTPIQEAGNYSLGSVYGNMTINTSGVTLRNTTIAGDLYLTGGIGLGEVLLENVNVLGRIVTSGAGESSKGDNSIILRNVNADSMVVDSISNQFVTLRAEGDTAVDATSVRTAAYLEDVTVDGYGLKYIEVDGEDGLSVQLAGNIKEVLNRTPSSRITFAQGVAAKVTVDERATGSGINIVSGARVKELNLDVASSVSGAGDIDSATINAPGCTVAMLPDTVSVRPGITANVGSEVMDSAAAAESSADPRLLAGYPTAKDVAPTSATLVFSTNKRGTVYWAVSALADGSVSEDDVISPPTYATNILKSGRINATASKTEYTTKITGLTRDGGYYVTAVMVDNRDQHSPVKVAAFATPDDSIPAFASGYPVLSRITNKSAQVTVMTTKSCQLYYALMPKGSTAPTAQDFKTGSLSGNLGYATLDAVKNSTLPFTANSVDLEELATYDLYLWLTDYDGAKSSQVRKVTFTTIDGTPPLVRHIDQTDSKATSVTLTYALNEPGTLYWAVVQEDADFFRPVTGTSALPEMTDEAAKIQVEAGMGAVRKGTSSAARADNDVNLTISGLKAETSYDVYYVAKDRAGNYADSVQKITIHTLDNNAPSVAQEFTRFNETVVGGNKVQSPLSDTDIRLVFSEPVQGVITDVLGQRVYQPFRDKTGEDLAEILRQHITMYYIEDGERLPVRERNAETDENAPWVIDYRNAVITVDDGKMAVTFPTTSDPGTSALNLSSGATYLFHISGMADTAVVPNIMSSQDLPTFRTVYAQINLSNNDVGNIDVPEDPDDPDSETHSERLDMSLNMRPVSTKSVPDTECWDLLLWCDTPVEFDVYRRVVDSTKGEKENGYVVEPWSNIGRAEMTPRNGTFSGVSLFSDVMISFGQAEFGQLNQLEPSYSYQYGIQFTNVNDLPDYNTWSSMVTMKFGVAAAGSGDLRTLAGDVTKNWNDLKADQSVTSIGMAYAATGSSDELTLRRQFTDRSTPEFLDNAPSFEAGSSAVKMNLALDRDGTIYYVVAPKTEYPPAIDGKSIFGGYKEDSDHSDPANYLGNDKDYTNRLDTFIPASGTERTAHPGYAGYPGGTDASGNKVPENLLTTPSYRRIVNPNFSTNPNIKTGTVKATGYVTHDPTVENLIPETEYYVYFVIQGGGEVFSEVQCYQFETGKVETPIITAQNGGTSASVSIQTDQTSAIDYALVEYNSLPDFIRAAFSRSNTTGLPSEEELDKAGIALPSKVLDAMVEIVPAAVDPTAGGKTWFDMYATDYLKGQIRDYIKGDLQIAYEYNPIGSWGVASQPAFEVVKNTTGTPTDFTKMMEPGDLEYVVLVTARHIYSSEDYIGGYGFGAVRSMNRPDPYPPEYSGEQPIIRVTNLAVYSKNADGSFTDVSATYGSSNNPRQFYYSGRIVISFDKPIYQLQGNTRSEIWQATSQYVSTNKDTADAVSIVTLLGGSVDIKDGPITTGTAANSDVGVVSVANNASGTRQSFVLQFEKIQANSIIQLPANNAQITSRTSAATTKILNLIFDPTIKNSDYAGEAYLNMFDPGFRVTWK